MQVAFCRDTENKEVYDRGMNQFEDFRISKCQPPHQNSFFPASYVALWLQFMSAGNQLTSMRHPELKIEMDKFLAIPKKVVSQKFSDTDLKLKDRFPSAIFEDRPRPEEADMI